MVASRGSIAHIRGVFVGLLISFATFVAFVPEKKFGVLTDKSLGRNGSSQYFASSTDEHHKIDKPDRDETGYGRPYLIPNDEVLNRLNEGSLIEIFWRYVNTMQILCRNQTRVGSLSDGGKEVCIDESYKPKKPCIVYSFGSNFQFDFDLGAHNLFGCDVYTFDPSMDIKGKNRHRKIPNEITYVEVGLSSRDQVKNSWRLKTLETIMNDLKHSDTIIDILKMDIEGPEWDSIPNILETGAYRKIKQLLVEFHFGHYMSNPNNPYWGGITIPQQLRTLRLLYEYGFRVFMRERVMANLLQLKSQNGLEIIATQNEICFINTAYLRN